MGLQAGVSLLGHFPDNADSANILLENFRCVEEGQWVCSAICRALENHHRLKSGQSLLRMPAALTEPAFVSQLKSGAAIRVLQTLAFLTRFNDIFGKTLDSILQGKSLFLQRLCDIVFLIIHETHLDIGRCFVAL